MDERRAMRSAAGRGARVSYLLASWLLLAGGAVQVFLAGLGVFESAERFATHRDFGYALGIVPLVMVILAIVGRLPRWLLVGAVVLVAQFALQSVFVVLRTSLPVVAALHPLNGFLILLLSVRLAVDARRLVPPPFGTAG